jgi:hypothetical protein
MLYSFLAGCIFSNYLYPVFRGGADLEDAHLRTVWMTFFAILASVVILVKHRHKN